MTAPFEQSSTRFRGIAGCYILHLSQTFGGLAVPLYEYQCAKCGKRTEKIETVSGPHLKKCPHCGGKVEQAITAPAIQFKGSGWDVTDYAGKSAGKEGGGGLGGAGKRGEKEGGGKRRRQKGEERK